MIKRILVRAPNWIGDQVMAYPFFESLRQRYPQAWISVVCTAWVSDIQYRGFVDEVLVLPKSTQASVFEKFRAIYRFSKELKAKGPWNVGITLPNSFGGALLLKLAGAQQRVGYATDGRGWLLTHPQDWQQGASVHRALAYLRLVHWDHAPAEVQTLLADGVEQFWKPAAIGGYSGQFDAVRHWPAAQPLDPPEFDFFVIAPGATADSRRWSADSFDQLIRLMHQKYGWKGVVVGGPAEQMIAERLVKRGLPIVDYTGKGSVSALWKLFLKSKVSITNESGLAHVASLCGSKVQIICGAADPRRTKPMGPGPVQVAVNPVECWPCERNTCKFSDQRHNQCLKGIEPEHVLEEMNLGFFTSP